MFFSTRTNLFRSASLICFETPDPAAGGGAGTAAPGAQPVQGQGNGAANGSSDFWGMFPNVPEEHRPVIEPHIREMQGHITRTEQQLAPFKPFLDAGLDVETTQGLLQFSRDFDTQPLEMWVKIGEMLQQQQGPDGRYVVDPDVDLEYLAALARGEDPDGGPPVDGTQPVAGGAQVPEGASPEVQSLLSTIQQLQTELQEVKQGQQQDRVQRQEAIQDQLFDRRLTQLRETVKAAGWPEELITDEELTARVIQHRGDFQAVARSMTDLRSGLLKGFTEARQQREPTDLPNGAPSTTDRETRQRDRDDVWAKGRRNASSRLRRANRTAAQE